MIETQDKNIVPGWKYKGKLWSEVPKSYLEFCGNFDNDGILSKLCREELVSRNTKLTEIRVLPSGHDSASFHCLDMWKDALESGETSKGLHSYTIGLAKHANEVGDDVISDNEQESVRMFRDKIFIFVKGKIYDTLKSIRDVK